ncbi:hypothetical protein Taro_039458 [Colocasia esculenta]|uniref:Uncharacterized protein n=1 Tax=Colocasia esculenta TaxID=4460 RepID=A0A843WIX8_COLES|nr:hypothetical protein [Colocasia esculenta]
MAIQSGVDRSRSDQPIPRTMNVNEHILPGFVVAERIGPIRPYRSGSWAGRCVIRKDPPAGRVSEGSASIRPRYADPPRSAPFRYADALRIGTVQSRFAGVSPPAPFSPIFPPSPSRKPQIYTLGDPRRLPTWIGRCLEVFLGFSHPSLHPFDCFEGGAIVDDDAEFERLMNLGPSARSQFMREARAIASAQPRRKGSHTQAAAPSQPTKGKGVATSQPTKGKGKDIVT